MKCNAIIIAPSADVHSNFKDVPDKVREFHILNRPYPRSHIDKHHINLHNERMSGLFDFAKKLVTVPQDPSQPDPGNAPPAEGVYVAPANGFHTDTTPIVNQGVAPVYNPIQPVQMQPNIPQNGGYMQQPGQYQQIVPQYQQGSYSVPQNQYAPQPQYGQPVNGQAQYGQNSSHAPVQSITPQPMAPAQTQPVQPIQQMNNSQVPVAPVQIMPNKSHLAVPTAPATAKESPVASHMGSEKREDLDLMTHLTQRSNRVFLSANNKAKELHNTYMDSEHLLHGLLADGEIYQFLTDQKIQPQLIEEELAKVYKKESSQAAPQIAPRIKKIIGDSLVIARKLGFEFISPEHILLSMYEEGEGMGARILVKLGLKKEDLNKKITGKKEGMMLDKDGKPTGQTKAKSALEEYTIDLTAKAAQGLLDPVVERSEVIERVIHILSRRTKNNPALVGEAGVGKTAIVEGLAEKIASRQVPETLLGKRILQLDLMGVLAGASHRGEFEERMKNLIEEVQSSKGQIIMFIDEIHNIVGAGGGSEGQSDVSNFLKPALSRGELQLIGATTLTEYRKYIEKDPALERRFQPVIVPEPTEEAAIKMLKVLKNKYEAFHKVKIPDEVIEAAVKLSKRYVGDRFLPDKAVDLIDEAGSAVRLPLLSLPEEIKSIEDRIAQLSQEKKEAEARNDKVRARILNSKIDEVESTLKEKKDQFAVKKAQTTTEVTIEIIKDVVSRWTGIPVSKISSSELEKLTKLEDVMHKRMIDQENAVSAVAQAVRRGRAGLKSQTRPIGSFVFLGPTGVGKTELAKTLAEVLFDQEEAMIRFDMTEYMEKHEVAKLLGAPPGYVGYEEGGKLTEAVRRRPYSVVLFDEVEKAHPDIFNILLQILDDGRLTDNKGHTVSFKNTVVICTSNIGSIVIQDELLKNSKGEVEEPPALSTYTFSPRGREIMTIGSKYFIRDGVVQQPANGQPAPSSWTSGMLLDYFSGQIIEENSAALQNTGEAQKKQEFPIHGFDTHAISTKGVEVITKGNMVFTRTATTAKIWQATDLITYFKDATVINAMPDAPDEQIPTARLKTHCFTPDEMEVVTFTDRYWRRKEGTNDWQTGYLKDYFTDQKIDKGAFPTTHWDIHTISPSGREIVSVGDMVWVKEPTTAVWIMSPVLKYFGADFPLDKELEERSKVEDETDKKKYDLLKDKVMNELRKFFRPELINRFDEVIMFEPLKFIHMMAIVKLQLKGVAKLLEDQDMGFVYTDASIKEIVRNGFDPVYGARPLRRAIQKLVENPISGLIIDGKAKAGDSILLDFNGEEFTFIIDKGDLVKTPGQAQVKKFICEVCSTKYKSEVKPESTPICAKCASIKVHEDLSVGSEPDENKKTQTPSTNGSLNTPSMALNMPTTPASMTNTGMDQNMNTQPAYQIGAS